MSLTHKWAKESFCHIMTVVFHKTLDSSFVKVLEEEGYTKIISMLSLHEKTLLPFPLPSVISTSSSSSSEVFTFTDSSKDILSMTWSLLCKMILKISKEALTASHPKLVYGDSNGDPSHAAPLLNSKIVDPQPLQGRWWIQQLASIKCSCWWAAKFLLSSSPFEPQAIPTPLVLAPMQTVFSINVTMVIPAKIAPVPRSPWQDNDPNTSDHPCIDLIGGEILPSQLYSLSADQESKKFYLLDSAHQDLMDSLLLRPLQQTLTPVNHPCQLLCLSLPHPRYLVPLLWPKLLLTYSCHCYACWFCEEYHGCWW